MEAGQAIETVEGAGRVECSEAPILCRVHDFCFEYCEDVSKVPHNN